MSDRKFNTLLVTCILIVIVALILGLAFGGVLRPGNSTSESPYGIGIAPDGSLQPTTYGVGANGQPTVPIP